MEIHRRLHLSQQQVAFRIFHPAIGHGRIHDHHGRAFTFLERDIQRQLPPHGAGLIAPVFHLVGQLFCQRGVLKHRIQVAERAVNLPGDNQAGPGLIIKRRHVHVHIRHLAIEQIAPAGHPLHFPAINPHIRVNPSGLRPVRQERQAHVLALITHLESPVLLPAFIDFHRPLIEQLAPLQMAIADGLSQPAGQAIGQPLQRNVVIGTGTIAIVNLCRQTQLGHLLRAHGHRNHGLTVSIRVHHAQAAGAHHERIALTLPAKHPGHLPTQFVVIQARQTQRQIIAVQMRQPRIRRPCNPPVQTFDAGNPVIRLAGQAGKAHLKLLQIPRVATQVHPLHHTARGQHRQLLTHLVGGRRQAEWPALKLLADGVHGQFIGAQLPLAPFAPGLPAQRHITQRERAGGCLAGQIGQRQGGLIILTQQ